jgi:hypothetical protein
VTDLLDFIGTIAIIVGLVALGDLIAEKLTWGE